MFRLPLTIRTRSSENNQAGVKMSTSYEDAVFLAKLAEQAERYEGLLLSSLHI